MIDDLLPFTAGADPVEGPRVRRLPVRQADRERSALVRIDYADTFVVDVGPTSGRTAEQWARAILEDAPLAARSAMVSGWTAIGLKLDLGRPDAVLGWAVRHSTADSLVLGAASRVGMRGALLFNREPGGLRFGTFVRHDTRAARLLWVGVERVHGPFVHSLLDQASHRLYPQAHHC